MTIGERVYSMRRRRHWSRSTLSKLSGLHTSQIKKLETNARIPSYTTLERLAKAFNVEMDALFHYVHNSLEEQQ